MAGTGKVFEYYSLLPAEIRMEIIDEMDRPDRCRFSKCSELSQKDVRSSRKFIYSLEIYCESQNSILLTVQCDDSSGCILTFKNTLEGKSINCYTLNGEEIWKNDLCPSTDLVQKTNRYFKMYQKSIKKLEVSGFGNELNDFNFEIENCKNLEELVLDHCVKISEFVSKTQHPLKTLKYEGWKNLQFLQNDEKLYSVSKSLIMPHLKLNNEQFLKLSASNIEIHIGDLTVNDLHMFIKSWQKGEVRSHFRRCEWSLRYSEFDERELYRLVGERIHAEEPGKMADLFTIWPKMIFIVLRS